MAAVALIVHLGRESAAAHARELTDWLEAEGHEVRVPAGDGDLTGLGDHCVDDAGLVDGLDLIVTLGGDGSILRAVELAGESEVPILGVDFGRLGYLTEVAPDDAREAVRRALVGDHDIESRMLISTTIVTSADGRRVSHLALNEAVIERSAEANTIRLGVEFDGEFFTSYAADGLIVATPTGSTAYAFSVRGPIIAPMHRSLLLTPVSPHMLFDRSLVLAPSTVVRMTVDGHRPASVSVDGRRIGVLGDGDQVECTESPYSARLVTFGSRRFHRVLKAKFGLNDR